MELFKINNEYAFDGKDSQNESIVNIRIQNTSPTETYTPELFNTIQSHLLKGAAAGVVLSGQAFAPFNGYTSEAIATSLDGTIMLDSDGNAIYRKSSTSKCQISVTDQDTDYRDLLTSIAMRGFTVTRMKITTLALSQIQQGRLIFKDYSDLGKVVKNPYSLATAFSANQFQNTTLDVNLSFELNKNKGMAINILPNEVVTIQLFIQN